MNPIESLRAAYGRAGLTERAALNHLQDAGVISDLVVTVEDIATADLDRATRHFVTTFDF